MSATLYDIYVYIYVYVYVYTNVYMYPYVYVCKYAYGVLVQKNLCIQTRQMRLLQMHIKDIYTGIHYEYTVYCRQHA